MMRMKGGMTMSFELFASFLDPDSFGDAPVLLLVIFSVAQVAVEG